MSESMSRVLVCFTSGTGCTKGVAEKIAATLVSEGSAVELRTFKSNPDPAAYDAVVAGSGVRAGGWQPIARRWLARNASALRGRPLALFAVGIAMAHGPEKVTETISATEAAFAKTGLEPVDVGAFAGWYDPARFNFVERKIMNIAKAPEGDFRDWTAIEAWARRVSPKLAAATAVTA